MSKNILEALGKIDVALGGNANDAVNVIDALDQISQGAGSLKTSVDNINGVQMKICGIEEYDEETGIPIIENPVEGTFYLTPAGQQDNNIFNEYYYKDGQWEMFGGASINVNDLFNLSDRMAKGINFNGNVIDGAIKEGNILNNVAQGVNSHAEGNNTEATGTASHAEGQGTKASNFNSHAEGQFTTASGYNSHAEGNNTIASGYNSHAEGTATKANHRSQHVFGEFNIEDPSTTTTDKRGNYVEIVGNGTTTNAKSNARTLDWSGNETLSGSLTLASSLTLGKGTADEVTITAAQLKALLAKLS